MGQDIGMVWMVVEAGSSFGIEDSYIDIRVDTIDVSYVFTRMPHARTQHMQIGYDGLKMISEVAHRHGYRIRAMLVKTRYARSDSHTR